LFTVLDSLTIKAIVAEIAPKLEGRVMGKVFQLSRVSLAIDFRTNDGSYLFLSVEPAEPRLYLIERRVRELEKQALPPSSFALTLRKHLSGATLRLLNKDEGDRIVRFTFDARDVMDNAERRVLVAQLTGKAANLLLLDEHGYVIDALRPPRGPGQQIGELYQQPPAPAVTPPRSTRTGVQRGSFDTLSEAADLFYQQLKAERAFQARAASARERVRRALGAREKLRRHLLQDLAGHGDAEEHKRTGDLLLANIATAERRGGTVLVTDYYAEGTPRVELLIDENSTLQEEAARRFRRYTKAKRAAQEITRRLAELEKELEALKAQQSELERIIAERDEAALEAFFDGDGKGQASRGQASHQRRQAENIPGVRRYRSSDGYEILVGRAARDNDHLTFRVARPHDLWMHAADYPGSHVVVRNPSRKEIPQRTVIEAAQLAAHFSQARASGKVDVHYTERKFISKPKGAAPGLVRLSSFRNMSVEPRVSVERA
jgi:predicted ribosome quality control (RQC) complex YloA/Tae2 family protein